MYHKLLQQFECDETQCHKLIDKKAPVIYDSGLHFCSPECYRVWQDKKEDDIRFQEEMDFVIGASYD